MSRKRKSRRIRKSRQKSKRRAPEVRKRVSRKRVSRKRVSCISSSRRRAPEARKRVSRKRVSRTKRVRAQYGALSRRAPEAHKRVSRKIRKFLKYKLNNDDPFLNVLLPTGILNTDMSGEYDDYGGLARYFSERSADWAQFSFQIPNGELFSYRIEPRDVSADIPGKKQREWLLLAPSGEGPGQINDGVKALVPKFLGLPRNYPQKIYRLNDAPNDDNVLYYTQSMYQNPAWIPPESWGSAPPGFLVPNENNILWQIVTEKAGLDNNIVNIIENFVKDYFSNLGKFPHELNLSEWFDFNDIFNKFITVLKTSTAVVEGVSLEALLEDMTI